MCQPSIHLDVPPRSVLSDVGMSFFLLADWLFSSKGYINRCTRDVSELQQDCLV